MRSRFAMRSAAAAAFAWMGVVSAQAEAAPRAHIDTGVVVGLERGPAEVFLGIPYAAPPTGPLRWKPPAPAASWASERPATAPPPACPQKVNANGTGNVGGYAGPISEDCLTLDVTAPKGAKRAPVMVWIYGGGNIGGATNLTSLDGRNFARDGVVLVAMNYRLGPFGFFAHPALTAEAAAGQPLGSYGLMDQIAALKWVKRNIAAFGGDPSNVTIFGESAGGIDVLALLNAPSARGLYKKAIVESGAGWDAPITLAQAEAKGAAVAGKLGLSSASATALELRALPMDKLLGTITEMSFPIVDGRLLKEGTAQGFARGHANPVPLIIGSNSDEATLMSAFGLNAKAVVTQASAAMRTAYASDAATESNQGRMMFNDQNMGAPARWIARKQSMKAPAWLYYFSYVPERQRSARPGAAHASEIVFAFDSIDAIPGRTPLITPGERAQATLMHSCWVGFAKTGRPTCGGQPWPAYNPASDQLLEFGEPAGVRAHFRKPQLDAQEAAAAAIIGAK
ncbi:carboxylesterase/lipase family protein [Phenylobacterium sp.]|uniref:carboxylesterase/lipase family protein n=1 Tax=Phenylobacterium sp. TaxID=1871053 RepID=UPI0035630B07